MKGVGGFYYVRDTEGNIHECKACGKFRKQGIKPLAGDHVQFDPTGTTSAGAIQEIEPRTTVLARPRIANVDTQLVVISPGEPAPDFMLVDRLLIQARSQGIEPLLVVNKCDLDPAEAVSVARQYEGACRTFLTCASDGTGVGELRDALRGRTVCLSGQSAVGKSTILNRLCGLQQETGGLSARTQRGRHTTRTAELFWSDALQAYIADTPGFSVLELSDLEPQDLVGYSPDIAKYAQGCRFSSCLHRNEPGCSVRAALEAGKINANRYERYLRFLRECEENKTW